MAAIDANTQTLGDRMKTYEKKFNENIQPNESFIVRLDGKNFSKFTKGFQKPFDDMFIKTMCLTMKDLVKKFDAQTGYTHSDEITLIFNKVMFNENENEDDKIRCHAHNGRIQKIISLAASYCSIKFNHHLNTLMNEYVGSYVYKDTFIGIIKNNEQIFDARVIIFNEKNEYEIVNHQIWRSVQDCERNAILGYAHTIFGHKKIMNKHCGELKDMLLAEKNINWDNISIYLRHGVYCKKMLVEKKINENESVTRAEYIFKTFKISFSDDNLNMLLFKYWNDNVDEFDLNTL
jgi:tRNA(His) 5'-end guanylyltransferase